MKKEKTRWTKEQMLEGNVFPVHGLAAPQGRFFCLQLNNLSYFRIPLFERTYLAFYGRAYFKRKQQSCPVDRPHRKRELKKGETVSTVLEIPFIF